MALHSLSAIESLSATEPGALDGFGFRCSCVDGRIAGSSSLPTLAHELRAAHAAWAISRGDKVCAA